DLVGVPGGCVRMDGAVGQLLPLGRLAPRPHARYPSTCAGSRRFTSTVCHNGTGRVMIAIDYRSRTDAGVRPVDFAAFHDQVLPPRLHGNTGQLAARGIARLGLPPLAIEVDDRSFTYVARNGSVELVAGRTSDAAVAAMDAALFSDLVL